MNDNDVLCQVRESFPVVHMETPVESIVARARSRQRHRRAGLAVSGLTTGLVGVVAISGVVSPRLGSPPADRPTAQLAAYTMVANPGGSTALTLRKGKQYRLDPDALRDALAQHGIPALVTVGRMCNSDPEPASGVDQVVSPRRLPDGSVTLTINPAALPPGSKLSIGYFPTPSGHTGGRIGAALAPETEPGTGFALITDRAPLRCAAKLGAVPNNGSREGQRSKPVPPGQAKTA
jgi:hypothetical protein